VTKARNSSLVVKRVALGVVALGAYALSATVADFIGKSVQPGATALRWLVLVVLAAGVGASGVALVRLTRWAGTVLAADGLVMLTLAAVIFARPSLAGTGTHSGLYSLLSAGLWLVAAVLMLVSGRSRSVQTG
jgi:hypothetical protein